MLTNPPYRSLRSRSAGNTGRPSSAKLTLADVPWNRNRLMFSTKSPGSSRRSTISRKVRRGSSELTTTGARSSVPSARATPTARPSRVSTVSTGDVEPDLRAVRLSRPRHDLGEAAVAALVEAPHAVLAVVLAHRVVEEDEAGTRRHRADLGADDAGRGDEALEDVALEVVVEEVRGRPGEEPHEVVHHLGSRRP